MLRVLKILVIILLSSLATKSQFTGIYIKPNNSYGIIWNRGRFDSTFFYATYCGVPAGTAGLHSNNQHMSALYFDSCGHKLYVFDPSDSSWSATGSTTTASNGLTKTGSDIKLGGAFTQNNTWSSSDPTYRLTLNGVNAFADGPLYDVFTNGSNGIAIQGESDNGRGVYGFTNTGFGLWGNANSNGIGITGSSISGYGGNLYSTSGVGLQASSGSNTAIIANIIPSSTSSVAQAIEIIRSTSGTPANGIGVSIDLANQSSVQSRITTQLISKLTDVTDATYTSSLEFWNAYNATLARKAILAGTGQWTWDGYPALSAETDTATFKPVGINGSGVVGKMANWVGSGGSVTLNNIGSGYRWVATPGGNFKTSFAGYGILKDSTANTNGITDKVDTATLKSVYIPLNLNANKTINKAGYNIYYTGNGQDKFDSTVFTQAYSSPFIGADSLVSFGNSITAGLNATVPDSNYAHRTAAAFGVPLVNKGVSSTVAYQACASSLAYINPGHTAIQTFCIGLNDFRTYGGGVNEYNGVKNAYEAAMQNQFLASYVSASDGTVTRYGSWTTNYNAVSGSGGKTTTAAYSNTLNDSLVVNITGTSIALGVIGLYTTGRDCIVYIDGVRVDSFSTSNQCFLGAYAYQSMGKYYTGFSSGSHHVKLKVGPGGTFLLVDYIGTLVSAASMKPFIFIHIPHMDATGYAGGNATAAILDHANDSLTAAYNRAKTAGLNVYLAQTNNNYVATTSSGLSSDHIHPNDKGHGQIETSILAGMNTSKTYPGTVTYSNDGHFYGAFTDSSRKQIAYATDLTLQKVISNSGILSVPNTITGNNTLDFTGFSRLSINNFVVNNTTNQAYMHGNLGVQGSSGGVSILNRTGDTATGYQWYANANIVSLNCLLNGKDILRIDSGLRLAMYGRYNNMFAPTATIHIGGNNTGVANQIPLKMEKSILTATPEPYGWEVTSTKPYWTDSAAARHDILITPGSDVTGDSYYRNSSGVLTRLAIGSTNQVLTVIGGLPSWHTVSGSITSINSQTGTSQTLSGGTGISVSSSGDTHTFAMNTTLQTFLSDVNNSGTSETDLFSHTLAANTLTLNGQSVRFKIAGTLNDITATEQLKGSFAGTGIFDSGALTISATGDWSIEMEVTRTTSSTGRASVIFNADNATIASPVKYTALTGITWSNTNIFKLTGTAGGGTGGSNDITATIGKVIFVP